MMAGVSEKRATPSITTRRGDDGTTDLLFGQRVPKNDPRLEAVGAIDELNGALGLAKAAATDPAVGEEITRIQRNLIGLMGEIACETADRPRYRERFPYLDAAALDRLDREIDRIEKKGISFEGWALPGGNPEAAALDFARTIARRAERRLLDLTDPGPPAPALHGCYINRVSDLLWLLARKAESR